MKPYRSLLEQEIYELEIVGIQSDCWSPFEVSVFRRKTETSNALALGILTKLKLWTPPEKINMTTFRKLPEIMKLYSDHCE